MYSRDHLQQELQHEEGKIRTLFECLERGLEYAEGSGDEDMWADTQSIAMRLATAISKRRKLASAVEVASQVGPGFACEPSLPGRR